MEKQEPLLSLKIHRVVPSDSTRVSSFLTRNEIDTFFRLEDNSELWDKLPDELMNDWKFLPKSYSQIYLGETFTFYVKSVNDSVNEPVTNVIVRIDMQLSSNRVINVGERRMDQLDCKQGIHMLLQHEVKEMGSNVLICTVSYKNASNDDQSFRKFFKFNVDKPLDVKTKFYNSESDEVYLEALLQNLTNVPMCLTSVNLEPSQHFDCKPLNKIRTKDSQGLDDTVHGEQWVFGPVNRFQPNEFRQYLFCLSPKEEIKANFKLLKSVTVIGKLDIVWMSGIGCNGHLQTSLLERMAPSYKDIKLTVVSIPSMVMIKQIFDIVIKLTNCSDAEMEPYLSFDNQDKEVSICWLGISGSSLGKVLPGESIDFNMKCYPVKSGLSPVPSIKISVPIMNMNETFNELSYVFIQDVDCNGHGDSLSDGNVVVDPVH